MKTLHTLLTLLLISCASLIFFTEIKANSTGQITGQILANKETIPFANIGIKGTTIGCSSDKNGYFTLENLTLDIHNIIVSAVGFETKELTVDLTTTTNLTINITLNPSTETLEQVVVTGTMKETYISQSPVKVDVITAKFLEKNKTTNLVDAIATVNGVQQQVDCGVCFTSNIRINGLEGPYTMVLVDGSPIYSNLASVYGLSGIPTALIDRMEIIKGPSSTLYGSEAIAGVINVITKSPSKLPKLNVDIMGTTHGEHNIEVFGTTKQKAFSTTLTGTYFGMHQFLDENKDGFSDIVNIDRLSLFNKWEFNRKSDKRLNLAAKIYYEDRRNGVEDFMQGNDYKTLRGSETIYGESIYTNRLELFGTYELNTSELMKIDYSLSLHDQDSYYGSDQYKAKQNMAYTNFIWNKPINQHDILFGATARYQVYDDNTVATSIIENDTVKNNPNNQFIPGVFVQDEWTKSNKLTVLSGGRLDYYKEHGFIFAPRLNVKYKPATYTTFRANMGTGFRVVNLFTEDHAFISGNRTVEIAEALDPERSWNVALNMNHVYVVGESQGTVDIDGFYTYFTNAIVPNYDEPSKIVYNNTNGNAITKGISASIDHRFSIPLNVSLGATIQEVTRTTENEEGKLETAPIEFSPTWSGVFTLSYALHKWNMNIDYTGNIVGHMALPEVFDIDPETGGLQSTPRPTTSKPYTLQNLQITKRFPTKKLTVYGGVKNLFNWRQDSPLVAYNDPNHPAGFSPYFDTAYAYAPIHGREIYLGMTWQLGK